MKVKKGHVLVQHISRKDDDGNTLVTTMSMEVYKRLPNINEFGGKEIPKQGWKIIKGVSLIKPRAAKEAESKAAAKPQATRSTPPKQG